jgi:hypothetical protein
MHKYLTSLLAAGALLCSGSIAFAHHPFSAEYDSNKPAQVEGKVTKVDWTNPHSFLTVDTRDANGKVEHVRVELGSPKALTDKGWKRADVKVGDEVKVDGWYGRDSRMRINAKSITLKSSGHEFDAASSFYEKSAAN